MSANTTDNEHNTSSAQGSSTELLMQRIKQKKEGNGHKEGGRNLSPEELKGPSILDKASNNLQIVKIDINDILPNPYQPRKTFINIDDLAQSIKDNGLLQPIVVARIDNKDFLVAGERRLRAQKQLALGDTFFQKINSIIMPDLSMSQLKFYALIENIQRESMTLLETANAYKSLVDDGLSLQDIATKVGKGKTSVHRYVTIANQPSDILIAIEKAGIFSSTKIETILKSNISDDDKIVLIEKLGTGYKESQIKSAITRLLLKDTATNHEEDSDDLFASAMIPVKKRSYTSLPRDQKVIANKYLQTIADAKKELISLLQKSNANETE